MDFDDAIPNSNMRKLGEADGRLKSLVPIETKVRDEVIGFCYERYQIEIERKYIAVKKTVVYLNIHPILKKKILIERDILLKNINTHEGVYIEKII